jgi:hypothetical protein
MESHPEEFRFKEGAYHDRWYNHISSINSYGNEADKAAIAEKTRDIRMAEVHEQIMEELCNGPENRRKEEEEAEYERKLEALARKQQQLQKINENTQKAILRIDSNGLVGVGTASPTTQLGGVISVNKEGANQ